MGNIASKESYTQKQIEVSKIAKAMAHPARIAILELLYLKNCTCNDIVNSLPLAQSTVSQHLVELKKAGLILAKSIAPKMIYKIDKRTYSKSKILIDSLF